MARFWVGTSGWNYKHWRGRFYPEKMPVARWFEHYAQHFDTVEINNTFYRLPLAETFAAWREQAPPGFLYAVKASRFLTHMKKLQDPADPLERILGRARELKQHLGPVLYQLPPRWKKNIDRLREFCSQLPTDLLHVLELREPSWLDQDVYDTLSEFGVCLCIHDILPDHPRVVTAPAVYVRFHGMTGKYAGSYTRPTLRRWATWMQEHRDAGRDVYAYFNNDHEAQAIYNALTLRELLQS